MNNFDRELRNNSLKFFQTELKKPNSHCQVVFTIVRPEIMFRGVQHLFARPRPFE